MMIRNFLSRTCGGSSSSSSSRMIVRQATRSQGTAIARHANEKRHAKSPSSNRKTQIPSSTIHRNDAQKDYFSSMAASLKRDDGDYYFEAHAEAFLSAVRSAAEARMPRHASDESHHGGLEASLGPATASGLEPRLPPRATELDLIQAADAVHDRESFDKILILMRHGEARHNVFEREWATHHHGKAAMEEANGEEDYPVDPMLTGKGCGQMLALSRQTATYLHKQTSLQPQLIVVSPLRRAIQSALIAFPTQTPMTCLANTPWICHPHVMESANGNKSEFVSDGAVLRDMFPGVEFGLLDRWVEREFAGSVEKMNGKEKVPLFENKIDLMGRTEEFLAWLKNRDERVVVVSSHATWLQSLCAFSVQYQPQERGMEMFKKGELRSLGIKFD